MKKQSILGIALASTLLLSGAGYKPDIIQEPVAEKKSYVKLDSSRLTPPEKQVFDFLIERGITDRAAMATVLGNIRAESMFHPNICEGGARVRYAECRRGGYGLIQWTTINRYDGLGRFAQKYGGDPSTLETQLRYMVNEYQWVNIEHKFKTPGKSISYYMDAAYYWLGWGIHGNRTHYAYDYYAKLG